MQQTILYSRKLGANICAKIATNPSQLQVILLAIHGYIQERKTILVIIRAAPRDLADRTIVCSIIEHILQQMETNAPIVRSE